MDEMICDTTNNWPFLSSVLTTEIFFLLKLIFYSVIHVAKLCNYIDTKTYL